MLRLLAVFYAVALLILLSSSAADGAERTSADEDENISLRADWVADLEPISRADWQSKDLRHLFERAGFGARAEDLMRFKNASPKSAVRYFTRASRPTAGAGFEHSGVFDEGLDPFPPSRPATTRLAKAQGHALGVRVKPAGNRPVQPVVNQFFYWLRASRLETDRVAYWWANQMLTSRAPLREKAALFWHGHFATNEDKVRDYRKMLQQIELFQREGLGGFAPLMVAVAQDPAMLKFLDAGANVKDAPNENFAREIMELFTMGVGNYSEADIREAARAFTGWNFNGLEFVVNPEDHDNSEKTFLGETQNFDGEDIIDKILEQEVTSVFIASKLYRYFVREELTPKFARELGARFRKLDMNVGRFLELLFLSKDFYSPSSQGQRIKPPVELMVSTYRKLGLARVPGVPDFNVVSEALGQRLLHPPTVAGWSQGQSWITPGLLFERGNFVLDLVFPDIAFVPPDRYPSYGANIVSVQKRLRAGEPISAATRPSGLGAGESMAASNAMADRDEAFNTRYGSYRGWQMAIERVRPISRHTARLKLAQDVADAQLQSPEAVVDYFIQRLFVVAPSAADRAQVARYLASELGTEDVQATLTYAEDALRATLHLLLSLPEYQLG